jgi:hypothetical protein
MEAPLDAAVAPDDQRHYDCFGEVWAANISPTAAMGECDVRS